MTRVAADDYARAYTIFDILNEPDARNLRWQAYSSPSCPGGTCPGMGDLYHQIMSIGHKINPSAWPSSQRLSLPRSFSLS